MTGVTQPGYHRRRIPASKGKRYPAEILTPDEVRALAAQCSMISSLGIRHRALIVLLYRSGLRISEALALRSKDINLEIGSVTVLHGKGGRPRTVGIDPSAYPHIEAWLERRATLGPPSGAPLFCTLKGGPIDSSQIRQLLPRPARRAAIEKRVHAHGYAGLFVMPTSAGGPGRGGVSGVVVLA